MGRIHHKNGDIALLLVQSGLAKTIMPKTEEEYDADYYKELRDSQNVATMKKLGLWENSTADASKTQGYEKESKKFNGKVLEVHSGDSMTVVKEGSDKERKVFLASVKAPSMARRDGEDEPWAWVAKEFVRKQLVGRKVKVEMEFKREVELKNGPNAGEKRTMEFASIFVHDKNVSVQLIERGFARANLSKFAEENSKHFEKLMAAEKKALGKKVGVHSKKPAKQYRFVDTT